jgi:bifunctional polynucleotide phosphatase/kinase
MAPKRLHQATLSMSGGLERKKVRSLSLHGAWKKDVPPGLLVFLPNEWPPVRAESASAPSNPRSSVSKPTPSPPRSIVAFDLDGTLITTKTGAKFPRSAGDWKLLYPQVAAKLKDVYEQGAAVVIFTNQGGVAANRIDETFVKIRMEGIAAELAIPVAFYVATAQNQFRKPSVGMWEFCVADMRPNGIDIERSIYVGDAAGRPAGSVRVRDFSDSDRKFAINIGIPFYTPEAYFEGAKDEMEIASLPLKGFDPREMANSETVIIGSGNSDALLRQLVSPPQIADLFVERTEGDSLSSAQILVLMCGSPASGKSSFAKRHLIPRGFKIVSQDTFKTAPRCLKAVQKYIGQGHSVVVDSTNPRQAGREAYIQAARSCADTLTVVVLKMQTPRIVAEHLNVIRSHLSSKARLRALVAELDKDDSLQQRVPAVAFNVYFKSLAEPTTDEYGVDRVGHVEFVPHVENEDELRQFGQFA